LVQFSIGAQDPEDLASIAARLGRLDLAVKRDERSVTSEDPGSEVPVLVEIVPKV
jgi:hypothetical protein